MSEKEPTNKKNPEQEQEQQAENIPDIPDDFYERLGVSRDASTEEINRAFKKKIKRFHPDRNRGSKKAEEWSQALSEARSTLADEESKKKYDQKHPPVEKPKEETVDSEREQEVSEAKMAVVDTYERDAESENKASQVEKEDKGDETIYDLSSAKKDKIGWFVFVEDHKVYINDEQRKDKNGSPMGPLPGTPLNPFWRKQTDLLTPSERFFHRAPSRIEEGKEKLSNFTRSLLGLNESPDRERGILEEYEKMVQEGQAEFMGELAAVKEAPLNHPKKNIPDNRLYKIMKKRYARKGSFDNYEFKLIGVYDEKGRFTGKTRLYRIKKEG